MMEDGRRKTEDGRTVKVVIPVEISEFDSNIWKYRNKFLILTKEKFPNSKNKSSISMKVGFKFENIIIWQKAMELGEDINTLSEKFPKKEIYNLSSQIRRAADSIALNISEGSIGQSNPEFKKFIGYAIRSLAEVITCFHKARMRNYISEQEFSKYYNTSWDLMNMMVAFRRNIR